MKVLRIRRALCAFVALTAVGWLACDGGSGPAATGAAPASPNDRFAFVRSQESIVRLDTRTGETWRMPVDGDGGWRRFGGPRDEAGAPARLGRYLMTRTSASAGRAQRGASAQVRLILLDRETGRTWLAIDTPEAQWALVVDGLDDEVDLVDRTPPGAAAETQQAVSESNAALHGSGPTTCRGPRPTSSRSGAGTSPGTRTPTSGAAASCP